MAENTGNFISKFAPNSYFFTDPGAFTQDAAQAFGPVSADVFRLTGNFTVSVASMAHAICTGIVLVQPQAGSSTKANLLLRPFKQPIVGLNIKYFVYRGLDITDFFDGDNLLPGTAEGASDLVKKVNTDFADFYNSKYPGQTLPPFLAKYIGFNPAGQADTVLIDDLFFKQVPVTETGGNVSEDEAGAFELPLVQIGSSLGHFAAGTCGMDVVISYGDYKLPQPNDEFVFDLAYARAAESTIDLSAETNAFKKKQLKEQIFQFLDIAAYYGFHSNDLGWVKTRQGSAGSTKKGEQIYTDLLQNFHTKNSLYLYIQSDRTRSYNFYGNYNIGEGPNCLKLGPTEATMTEQNYEDGEHGWPVIINKTPQRHDEAVNKLYLQFVTDNNPNTVLYGQVALIENAESNNFCGPDDLRLPIESQGNFTKTIILTNSSIGTGTNKTAIASFNILIYHGKLYNVVSGQITDENNTTTANKVRAGNVDDLFDLINAEGLLKTETTNQYTKLIGQRIKLRNDYFENKQNGVSAFQTLIVFDELQTGVAALPIIKRVTYITETIEVLADPIAISGTITTKTQSTAAVSANSRNSSSYVLPDPYHISLISFTDSLEGINGLMLETTDQSKVNKILVGITNAQRDVLNEVITDNIIANYRLFLTNKLSDGAQLLSTEGITYSMYRIGIAGEINGQIEVKLPAEEIVVYSLDSKCFFSSDYSVYQKEEISGQLFLNLDIAV